ncbi:hypothetical protein CU044_1741 [Streptomyces sp. L-9-10]|nr:hypothetical protein CU044_1741 [Streptomyces sp. L-9-10]
MSGRVSPPAQPLYGAVTSRTQVTAATMAEVEDRRCPVPPGRVCLRRGGEAARRRGACVEAEIAARHLLSPLT